MGCSPPPGWYERNDAEREARKRDGFSGPTHVTTVTRLYCCRACGAVVLDGFIHDHRAWHARSDTHPAERTVSDDYRATLAALGCDHLIVKWLEDGKPQPEWMALVCDSRGIAHMGGFGPTPEGAVADLMHHAAAVAEARSTAP